MRNLWVRLASWLGRRAQAAPLDPGNPFAGLSEEQIKATLAAALRGSFDAGVSAERARIAEILQLPGASKFQDLVVDLALGGDATPAQVAMVISRTEVHVQARLHPTKSSPLESASSGPTIH